nr:EAL domain-containing protein [uncultured Rhodoferax sp.]
MNKKLTITMATLAGLLAGAIPIGVTLHMAQRQSLQAEQQHMLDYAHAVLQRSERATKQVYAGIAKLQAHSDAPCSAAQMARMGEIDLVSADIQAMAHIANGRLLCTSYGKLEQAYTLPPVPGAPSKDGITLYTQVQLPFAPGMTFIVVERGGYAAIVHEAITVDIPTTPADVSLATYSPRNGNFRSTRGTVQRAWIDRPRTGGQATFMADGYLVATVESRNFSTVTLAALPLAQLQAHTTAVIRELLPLGILAGLALAFLVFLVARQQMALPAMIRAGLRRNEFYLLYQPLIDLHTGACVGAEALLRWRRGDGLAMGPDKFIPVAEESGLIQALTQRVLLLCAQDLGDLLVRYPGFHIGVNLSSLDLKSACTVERLRALQHSSGAGPQQLVVEATERGLMDTVRVREVIRDIRALGIEVAVDDFGTGYSSLSYLGTFALDYLKIDKSFVDTLGTGAATSHVAMHIIDMAKDLNLKMIAEGVETEDQARLLRERGVQLAQGWLFGKPMPMPQLVQRLVLQQRA